jgi:hypothetical protein
MKKLKDLRLFESYHETKDIPSKRTSHTRRKGKLALALSSLILIFILTLSSGVQGAAITEFELEEVELYDTKPYGIEVDTKTGPSYILAALYGSDKIAMLNPSGPMVNIFQLEDGSKPWDVVFDNRSDGTFDYHIWFTKSQNHSIGLLSHYVAGDGMSGIGR